MTLNSDQVNSMITLLGPAYRAEIHFSCIKLSSCFTWTDNSYLTQDRMKIVCILCIVCIGSPVSTLSSDIDFYS